MQMRVDNDSIKHHPKIIHLESLQDICNGLPNSSFFFYDDKHHHPHNNYQYTHNNMAIDFVTDGAPLSYVTPPDPRRTPATPIVALLQRQRLRTRSQGRKTQTIVRALFFSHNHRGEVKEVVETIA